MHALVRFGVILLALGLAYVVFEATISIAVILFVAGILLASSTMNVRRTT